MLLMLLKILYIKDTHRRNDKIMFTGAVLTIDESIIDIDNNTAQ